MPEHYDDAPDTQSPPPSPKKESKPKQSKSSSGKMSDAQKKALTKHMEKVGKDMSASEKKSHRMKMMSRMRKGMSVAKAHNDIKKSSK
jgi:tRNA C32,U32 (ribose-2'-O)-methylase TrmJ